MKFFRSIQFKIAASFFVVFMVITTIFNVNSFQTVRKSLVTAHHEKLTVQTQRILDQITSDSVPTLNQDVYAYQVWNSSLDESHMTSDRGNFPSSFQQSVNLLLPESYVSNLEPPAVLEIDDFTFCIIERYSSADHLSKTNLVAASKNVALYAQIESIKKSLLYNYLIAALIACVTVILISGLVLKPIKSLISKAQGIKASETMDRLPVSGAHDELTDLSKTINEMIERIETSIKDQGQFFASASHELRTPLANMLSELDLKIADADLKSDKKSFESFRNEVIRLSHLVEDFLLMSQLKADTLTIHKTQFRLDDLLYDVLEKMNPLIAENAFDISLNIGPLSKAEVNGDKSKMESILVNLIQNAAMYGSNSKPIGISQNVLNESIELTIINQVDFKKQRNSGNKLGLWICGKLAEKQGFNFKSTDEDGIFTATVTIPI
ncbi:HAMP domain-containing sensor histidine kinase [Roseivirga sp. E12]|uniref:sensor histidine kinase n=1 Tax=Roseivirga sp. E12 TaxID=2819237 RepID=UPI001ABCA025|nr:HAMP domain-containing sensor histidine kinase [Roseivirga sp. E12]MBO3698780.1 HAMP domain-containing histidine kinase [Roseivirga sp. E12]